ncbi:putative IBR domain-containing protein [Septoria linicola]|nr:putative IBR domain-containing protein [Septoria linicola]
MQYVHDAGKIGCRHSQKRSPLTKSPVLNVRPFSREQISGYAPQTSYISGNTSWFQVLPHPQRLSDYSWIDLSLRATLSESPDFHFCKSTLCNSGQVHDNGEIFTCSTCGHKHCVDCDVDWHSETTCADFQAKLRRDEKQREVAHTRAEEEKASEVCRISKNCSGPSCGGKIEKTK